jgi:Sec-independent protein translocase protein TatA
MIIIIVIIIIIIFGIEKCKTLSTAKGKLEMRNFTTQDDDTMEAMNEDDIYRYLSHMQSKQIKHAQMKQQLGEEYLNRTKSVLKIKLKVKNTIKAINAYTTPVLTLSFGIVKWTPTDLENRQTKTRTLLTRYGLRHPRAAKERLTLPRKMGGRGLADLTRLRDKQAKLLQTYFSHKQATSPLHAAVVKADDRYTPLDPVRADENDLATDEEFIHLVVCLTTGPRPLPKSSSPHSAI